MPRYHLIGACDDTDYHARGIEHEVFETEEELYEKLVAWEDRSLEYAVILGDEVTIDYERIKAAHHAAWLASRPAVQEAEERRQRELYEKLKAKYG